MSLLTNFDTNANFWGLHTLMKVPKAFAELYKKDKSKDKVESSKIMWAIAMLVDVSKDNKYRNLNEDDKKLLIKTDYLNDASFNFSTYQDCIDLYIKLHTSKLEQELIKIERKLNERLTFIEDTPYDLDTMDKLDKAILNTTKMQEMIKDLTDKILQEKDSGTTRGGRVESASEKGII